MNLSQKGNTTISRLELNLQYIDITVVYMCIVVILSLSSSDYEDSEEDEESGKDWDELEEEARKGTYYVTNFSTHTLLLF